MNRVQIVIKSIMLRRQKDSKVDGKPVCTIPPKHTKVDVVEFTDDEHELYKALETKSQIQYSKYLQKGSYSCKLILP
jgi:SNF2 family DNA or RNA helicase